MKNKRGGDKIISVYWFLILFIVAGAIVYMTALFYGAPYDARVIEAEILTNKIADCLSQGGYLKANVLGSDNFKDNFLEECNLNFSVEEVYGWKEQGQYYVEVSFCEFDQDSLDGFGEEIFNLVEGNVNLKTSFLLERAEKEKNKNEMVVIHYTAGHSARGAIETMRDNKLSVHYIVEKDGNVISIHNVDTLNIKNGDKAFKYESERADHVGCYDVRAEGGKGKRRPKCSEVSLECISSAGLLKKECKSYLSDIVEEKKCCIQGYNTNSIGIELINLGHMCGATTGYCRSEDGEWTCKSVCEDKGKGIEISEIVWEEFTEEQINSLVNLVSDIVSRQSIPIDREHIIGHDEVTNFKSDPGPAFNWTSFMSRLKAQEKLSSGVGRSFYVVDRNNKQYAIKILAVVGKTEKNVA